MLSSIYAEASAQPKPVSTTFDSTKAISEIASENDIYIANLSKGDSTGLSNLYTADAMILNDGRPSTIGRAAIAHFYGGMIRHGVTGFTFKTTGVWGSDNNLIGEDGTLAFTLANGTVVAKGRYLLVWKRENGVLKIFRDTFFSDER